MTNFDDASISDGQNDSKSFAIKLQARLPKRGLKVWCDRPDIPRGIDLPDRIDERIEKAHNFLGIVSSDSVNSLDDRQEIGLAIKLKKELFP